MILGKLCSLNPSQFCVPTIIAEANPRLSLLLEAKTVCDYIILQCLLENEQETIICLLGLTNNIWFEAIWIGNVLILQNNKTDLNYMKSQWLYLGLLCLFLSEHLPVSVCPHWPLKARGGALDHCAVGVKGGMLGEFS